RDLTFSMMVSTSAQATWVFPAACLMQPGAPSSCDELAVFIQDIFLLASASSTSCTPASGGCSCHLAFDATVSLAGTYTTSGANLNLSVPGAQVGTSTYCVNRETMVLASMPVPPAMNSTLLLLRE